MTLGESMVLSMSITQFISHKRTMTMIANHVDFCLQSFKLVTVCYTSHYGSQSTAFKIADEFARFKVWSGNVGVDKSRKGFLDYHLRDSSHLQKEVKGLLVDLNGSLRDGIVPLYFCSYRDPLPFDIRTN